MLALVLTVCMSPLQSATLERLSLDDMIAKSTAIVRGKVSSSNAVAAGPVIYTEYTIQVSERFKGQTSDSIQVSVPGGTINGLRQSFSGAPTLNPGDDFVFFLFTGRDGRLNQQRLAGLIGQIERIDLQRVDEARKFLSVKHQAAPRTVSVWLRIEVPMRSVSQSCTV